MNFLNDHIIKEFRKTELYHRILQEQPIKPRPISKVDFEEPLWCKLSFDDFVRLKHIKSTKKVPSRAKRSYPNVPRTHRTMKKRRNSKKAAKADSPMSKKYKTLPVKAFIKQQRALKEKNSAGSGKADLDIKIFSPPAAKQKITKPIPSKPEEEEEEEEEKQKKKKKKLKKKKRKKERRKRKKKEKKKDKKSKFERSRDELEKLELEQLEKNLRSIQSPESNISGQLDITPSLEHELSLDGNESFQNELQSPPRNLSKKIVNRRLVFPSKSIEGQKEEEEEEEEHAFPFFTSKKKEEEEEEEEAGGRKEEEETRTYSDFDNIPINVKPPVVNIEEQPLPIRNSDLKTPVPEDEIPSPFAGNPKQTVTEPPTELDEEKLEANTAEFSELLKSKGVDTKFKAFVDGWRVRSRMKKKLGRQIALNVKRRREELESVRKSEGEKSRKFINTSKELMFYVENYIYYLNHSKSVAKSPVPKSTVPTKKKKKRKKRLSSTNFKNVGKKKNSESIKCKVMISNFGPTGSGGSEKKTKEDEKKGSDLPKTSSDPTSKKRGKKATKRIGKRKTKKKRKKMEVIKELLGNEEKKFSELLVDIKGSREIANDVPSMDLKKYFEMFNLEY